jgi:hypothetical protein
MAHEPMPTDVLHGTLGLRILEMPSPAPMRCDFVAAVEHVLAMT